MPIREEEPRRGVEAAGRRKQGKVDSALWPRPKEQEVGLAFHHSEKRGRKEKRQSVPDRGSEATASASDPGEDIFSGQEGKKAALEPSASS